MLLLLIVGDGVILILVNVLEGVDGDDHLTNVGLR
jgi:hypothetical protein